MATNYLKAGGMLKFVDTAEDDGFIFPAKNCEMIEVTNNTSVILTFSESGGAAGVTEFIAATTPITDVTTVATTKTLS